MPLQFPPRFFGKYKSLTLFFFTCELFLPFVSHTFYFFWEKLLTIITISLNSLSIPPHLSLSKTVNALIFSASRCSRWRVHFSSSSFFSLSYRSSTLSTLSFSSLARLSLALMLPAPDFCNIWVRFSASSFFSLSYRRSTLSKLSLSSLACFSIASSPFLGISGRGGGSFSTLFGSAERNSVGKFSFTVTVVETWSKQILICQGWSDFEDTP